MIYFKVSTDLTEALEPFSYAERGRLFTAMLEYAKSQTTEELCGNERFIWPMVKADIDRQQEAYDRKCETNRANGASRTQSHPVAANDSESQQINKINKANKERNKNNLVWDFGFDEFWQAYPKKTGKGEAKKAWSKIRPDAELLQQMLNAIACQSQSEQWRKDGGQFIPMPSTWLNQQRWEDEGVIVPAKPKSSKWSRVPMN